MESAYMTVNPDINPHSAKKAGVSTTNSVVLVKEWRDKPHQKINFLFSLSHN